VVPRRFTVSNSTENTQVINLVQAMLGSITNNFRAVFLECTDSDVALHFILEQEHSEDREEIEDIVFEFEALQQSGIDVEVDIAVDARPMPEIAPPGRMVFLRKE
jgi:hypothetical protein